MRWIIPKREVKKNEVGDTRVIKSFLFFPLQLPNKLTGEDEVRWWENVKIEQEFKFLLKDEWGMPWFDWANKRFVDE